MSSYISARYVGDTLSEATTPAAVPFIIDTLAPSVSLSETGGQVA